MRKRRDERVLAAVRPNVGVQLQYQRRLESLIKAMNDSFIFWLKAAYRKNPPVLLAQDEVTPASQLRIAINKLTRQWEKNFDAGAKDLAKYFALSASRRSDAALRAILRKAGMSVKFQMTPAMRDILTATVNENVALIKSIPQQYATQVAGSVMRSVTAGRDLASLSKELQQHYGVTRRRAAFIALDQNNKCFAAFTRARQVELGITQAEWRHSHGGREPRKTHLANDGRRFDTNRGWFDPDPKVRRHIFPGELPRCRCVSRSVVRGFT